MAIKDLTVLLATMQPHLRSGEFVFLTMTAKEAGAVQDQALMIFQEEEGTTVILDRLKAERLGLAYDSLWSMITCLVKSDLAAVGFMAAITNRLAAAGIPCNSVSAFHHDHLFVPASRAKEAARLLQSLSTAN